MLQDSLFTNITFADVGVERQHRYETIPPNQTVTVNASQMWCAFYVTMMLTPDTACAEYGLNYKGDNVNTILIAQDSDLLVV